MRGLAIALLLAACGAEPPAPDAGAADAHLPDAHVPGAHVPYLAGEMRRVLVPAGTRYVNDHAVVRDPDDGAWHLYGITDDSVGAPFEEVVFLHATAPGLLGPWTEQADVLPIDPSVGEQLAWAPHVVPTGAGEWTMFWYAGEPADAPGRGIRRARSTDLVAWERSDATAPLTRPWGGRDPFVMRDGERWLVYSVGVEDGHGRIVLSTSDDGAAWSEPIAVLEDPEPSFPWGNLESPFVVPYAGWLYLFVQRGSEAPTDYVRTLVFRSADPARFDWAPIADLRAHAAEVVQDEEGRWWITSAGWTSRVGEENRGVLIAPLGWAAL